MILSIKKTSKSFGGIQALDNCTLTIEREKITAIIGPNGSGKTTLFDVISGILTKEQGDIKFTNIDLSKLKDYEISKLGISRTFQQVRLFQNLTIKDHLEIALLVNDEILTKSIFDKTDNIKKIKKFFH